MEPTELTVQPSRSRVRVGFVAAGTRRGRRSVYDWGAVEGLLGELPDNQIATRLGCSRERVRQLRKKLGIPLPEKTAMLRSAAARVLNGYSHLLGVLEDRKLARLAGVSHGTVWRIRRRLGIPSAGRRAVSP